VDGGGCSSLTIAGVGSVIGVGIVARFIVAGAAAALGLWLIYVGMTNIGTRTSEETGVRRRVNQAIGEDNTYAGSKAVLQGWIRVGLGIAAIVFAVWFFFFGPEA
jgi:ABC-type multidrug transport system permease subunit